MIDLSTILGLAGILVSILAATVTLLFADRREVRRRYVDARTIVLNDLSRSLGQDSIPSAQTISAVIRSVHREMNLQRVNLDLEMILDDLLRSVTADPFLDASRRSSLQAQVQQVRRDVAEAPDDHAEEGGFRLSPKLVAAVTGTIVGGLSGWILFYLAEHYYPGGFPSALGNTAFVVLSGPLAVFASLLFRAIMTGVARSNESTTPSELPKSTKPRGE